MGLSDTIEYLLVFAMCCILYITLYKHYARKLSWASSFMGALGAVFVGIVFIVSNPIGLYILFFIASYIILTLKDML